MTALVFAIAIGIVYITIASDAVTAFAAAARFFAFIRIYFDFLMIASISTYLRISELEFMTRTGFL